MSQTTHWFNTRFYPWFPAVSYFFGLFMLLCHYFINFIKYCLLYSLVSWGIFHGNHVRLSPSSSSSSTAEEITISMGKSSFFMGKITISMAIINGNFVPGGATLPGSPAQQLVLPDLRRQRRAAQCRDGRHGASAPWLSQGTRGRWRPELVVWKTIGKP